MNYWTSKGGGKRKFWLVQSDRRGVRPGDSLEVTKRDGTTETLVVRRVVSSVAVEGDLCMMCFPGTPPVKHIPVKDKADETT